MNDDNALGERGSADAGASMPAATADAGASMPAATADAGASMPAATTDAGVRTPDGAEDVLQIGRVIVWCEAQRVVARHAPGIPIGPALVASGVLVAAVAFGFHDRHSIQTIHSAARLVAEALMFAALWFVAIRLQRINILSCAGDALVRGRRPLTTVAGAMLKVVTHSYGSTVLLVGSDSKPWVLESFASLADAILLMQCLSRWLGVPVLGTDADAAKPAPPRVWPPTPQGIGIRLDGKGGEGYRPVDYEGPPATDDLSAPEIS